MFKHLFGCELKALPFFVKQLQALKDGLGIIFIPSYHPSFQTLQQSESLSTLILKPLLFGWYGHTMQKAPAPSNLQLLSDMRNTQDPPRNRLSLAFSSYLTLTF